MRFFVLAVALTITAMIRAASVPVDNQVSAQGAAHNSPGVLADNAVNVPVDAPVNVCGNSFDLTVLLNGASSNACVYSKNHAMFKILT